MVLICARGGAPVQASILAAMVLKCACGGASKKEIGCDTDVTMIRCMMGVAAQASVLAVMVLMCTQRCEQRSQTEVCDKGADACMRMTVHEVVCEYAAEWLA
eukprot:1160803-Pelagomonas_calceolata.AAC.1